MPLNKQEQQQQETQAAYSPAPSPDVSAAPALNPPDSAAGLNAPLDAYLDAICALLPAEVSLQAVQDMRREMREHLEAATVAHRELGQTEGEAVQSALAQFGPPRAVARRWQQEWTETLSETKSLSVRSSLKVALKTWGAVDLVTLTLIMAYSAIQLTRDNNAFKMFTMGLITFAVLLGLPLLAGVVVGLRAARRPLFCTVGGNLLLLPLFIIGWTVTNHWYNHYKSWVTGKSYLAPFSQEFRDAVQSVAAFLPTWIVLSLLGCTLVLIGRHIKKRARRRQIVR